MKNEGGTVDAQTLQRSRRFRKGHRYAILPNRVFGNQAAREERGRNGFPMFEYVQLRAWSSKTSVALLETNSPSGARDAAAHIPSGS